MKVDGVHLTTLGAFLPPAVSTEQAIAEGKYTEELYQAAGLTGTHVAGDLPAADMAVAAARQAVTRAGLAADEIDAIIHSGVFHQGPDGWSPAGYILRELGVGNVPSIELRNGCNGMLTAFEIAVGQLTGAANRSTVLLTAGENFSTPMFDRWSDLGPVHIAGDGAAAVVLGTAPGFAELRCVNSGTVPELEGWQRGAASLLPPAKAEERPWDATERSMQFMAQMPLPELIEYVTKFSVDLVHRSLVDAGINASDLAKIISVNNDRRSVEQGLLTYVDLPMDRSVWDFGRSVGHVGACDLIISLNHLVETRQLEPGDNVMLLSAGPGWVGSSAVVTVTGELPDWSE